MSDEGDCEREHLDGNETTSEPRHLLAIVDHDDRSLGGRGDDLLAQ